MVRTRNQVLFLKSEPSLTNAEFNTLLSTGSRISNKYRPSMYSTGRSTFSFTSSYLTTLMNDVPTVDGKSEINLLLSDGFGQTYPNAEYFLTPSLKIIGLINFILIIKEQDFNAVNITPMFIVQGVEVSYTIKGDFYESNSIYIRFFSSSMGNVLKSGFYVDNQTITVNFTYPPNVNSQPLTVYISLLGVNSFLQTLPIVTPFSLFHIILTSRIPNNLESSVRWKIRWMLVHWEQFIFIEYIFRVYIRKGRVNSISFK
jgi:hypothetical protein